MVGIRVTPVIGVGAVARGSICELRKCCFQGVGTAGASMQLTALPDIEVTLVMINQRGNPAIGVDLQERWLCKEHCRWFSCMDPPEHTGYTDATAC
jgi:hypothetical protein